MVSRTNFGPYFNVGTYSKLTNSYCLVGTGRADVFHECIEAKLAGTIPIICTSIAESAEIGRLVVGNSKGLLVPNNTTETELQKLRQQLPDSVRLQCLDDTLASLGHAIACNNHVALIHPQLDEEMAKIIGDVLGVEVFRQTAADEPLVGANVVMNNKGAMVHRNTSLAERAIISELLQVPVLEVTSNMSDQPIANGIIVNDWLCFVGRRTHFSECGRIRTGMKLDTFKEEQTAIDKTRQAILSEILP